MIVTVVAAVVCAWLGTGLVRGYALRRSLLDVPNHRSSHTVPTPRGGGLAIVVVVMVATALQYLHGEINSRIAVVVTVGGGLIALVGWVDDRHGVQAAARALAHFTAAIIAVYFIGTPDSIVFGNRTLALGPIYQVLAVFGIVWLTNLFNFMDGIDGIAAGEATAVAAAGGVLLLAAGERGTATLAMMVGGASLGFLFWNWPPAKIFMGDVGSGFLGFVLAVIALASSSSEAVFLEIWLLLLGVFVFDATVTLVRRLGRERFYEAHRRHAYQRAVQSGFSHAQVALCVLLMNVALAAIGALAWYYPHRTPGLVVFAIVLLVGPYIYIERRFPMWGVLKSRSHLKNGREV